MVFHGLQNRLDRFFSIAVLFVIGQRIGFIDEENTADGFLDDFLGLDMST